MKARAFSYVRADSLAAARAAFLAASGDASYISGGQSLVPALALRLQAPEILVDLGQVADMRGVTLEGDMLRIGGLTRHAQMLTEPLIARHAPLLAQAAPYVAHPAIRNRGTLGGSVALADPASEFPAMMLAMNAQMEIYGASGTRLVPADDYFQDLYQTALEPGDILVALHVPSVGPRHRWAFDELTRRRGDYAMVGAGIQGTFAEDGRVNEIRIAFFSVAATPVRVKSVEAALAGQVIDAARIAHVQGLIEAELDPAEDEHLPPAMRLHLARVLLGRLLQTVSSAT
ncbi:xanthine dehydrogenase family protein subunit M [Xanthobacter sp. VNH20]|uniref:FAD binding domain-containing protein n=1 Tax=Xanthobacter sp. VNH20 TaxID=3156616 RepID=UPI0032B5FFB4